MTEAVLDRTEVASEVVDRAEIHDGKALVAYTRTEAALAELKARHEGAVFDLRTVAGDKAARAARLELVTLRTSLEKKRQAFKSPFLEAGKLIDSEAKRITAQIELLEKPIDAQIVADEKRRADEKAERERIEAERLAEVARVEAARKERHETGLATIGRYTANLHGMTAERLAGGVEKVRGLLEAFAPADWEEYAERAQQALTDAVSTIETARAAAQAREDHEADVKRQAEENARIAAENKAAAEKLAAETARVAAEQKAAADLLAAREAALAKAEADAQGKRDHEAAEAAARLAREQDEARIAALPQPAPAPDCAMCNDNGLIGGFVSADSGYDAVPCPDCSAPDVAEAPPAAVEPEPAAPPTLSLGTIGQRLGFAVTADFMASLGFTATQVKQARLFHEHQFAGICAAIVAHVHQVAKQHAD